MYSDEWIYVPIGMEGETALFDRQADPMAETNVTEDHPAAAKAMQDLLNRYLADLERQVAFLWARYPDAEVVTDIGGGLHWKQTRPCRPTGTIARGS